MSETDTVPYRGPEILSPFNYSIEVAQTGIALLKGTDPHPDDSEKGNSGRIATLEHAINRLQQGQIAFDETVGEASQKLGLRPDVVSDQILFSGVWLKYIADLHYPFLMGYQNGRYLEVFTDTFSPQQLDQLAKVLTGRDQAYEALVKIPENRRGSAAWRVNPNRKNYKYIQLGYDYERFPTINPCVNLAMFEQRSIEQPIGSPDSRIMSSIYLRVNPHNDTLDYYEELASGFQNETPIEIYNYARKFSISPTTLASKKFRNF